MPRAAVASTRCRWSGRSTQGNVLAFEAVPLLRIDLTRPPRRACVQQARHDDHVIVPIDDGVEDLLAVPFAAPTGVSKPGRSGHVLGEVLPCGTKGIAER